MFRFTKLLEVGLRDRQVRRWQQKKPTCDLESLSVSSVDFYDFSGQLLLLLMGYMIAVSICIVEYNIAMKKLYEREINISENPVHPRKVWKGIFVKDIVH